MNNKIVWSKWIPEIYLIASVIFYWVSSTLFNPIAFLLLTILAVLFIWKNKILGITIAILLLALSLYMVLALVSELNDFPEFNKDALIMLSVGATWLGLNILLSIMMIKKWSKFTAIHDVSFSASRIDR